MGKRRRAPQRDASTPETSPREQLPDRQIPAPDGAVVDGSHEPRVATQQLAVGERLLERSAVSYLATHRSLLVGFSYFVLRAFCLLFTSANQDVQRYFDVSGEWLAGLTPYARFELEYPPGSLLVFALPRLFTSELTTYNTLFACEMLAFDSGILYLLARMPWALFGNEAQDVARRYDSTLAMLAYVFLTGLLGPLALVRYDLACAFLFLLWLHQTMTGKRRIVADAALAVGIWVKLVSVIFLPIYLAYLYAVDTGPTREPLRPKSEELGRWLRGEGLRRAGSVALITGVLFLPFYLGAGNALFRFLAYHRARGVQIESTYASLLLFFREHMGAPLSAVRAFGAVELTHPWVHPLTRMSAVLTPCAVSAVSAWFMPRIVHAPDAKARGHTLIEASLALLLVFIFFNKVFSPQYLLWLAPLAPLLVLRDGPKPRTWMLGFTVTFLITGLILLFYYVNLLYFDPLPIWLLLSRNGLIAALAWSLMEVSIPDAGKPALNRAHELVQAALTSRILAPLSLLFCAAWILVCNFSMTTTNDVWIQLRFGEDIVQSGFSVPYTELYSATVAGRPFIAHEWLSGVIFYEVDRLWGGAGLSALGSVIAVATFFLMYCTSPREMRRSWWHLPLLLFLSYLLAFRVLVRPHIFTFVGQAALLFAVERWRRSGKLRELLWLVPAQLVWINLHGAALFGPAYLGMITSCVILMVIFPGLQLGGSEVRTFRKKDVYQLAGMTAALCLACLANPYGLRIVTFSLELMGNEHAKSLVYEWTTPFKQRSLGDYWFWLYAFGLLTLWLCLFARRKTLPLIDFASASLVTYLSIRANRFVPDFAIFSFPVIARTFHQLAGIGLKPELRVQRPWLEIGLVTLLLTSCLNYGYPLNLIEHRPVSWGYGGDMPYQEVQRIKELDLRGTIFNEYMDGGLIIHQLYPKVRVVLDSRIDLYPAEVLAEYRGAYVSPELFQRYVKKYDVTMVMLYRERAAPMLLTYLDGSSDWQRLPDASHRLLYVKKSALPPTTSH